jgi:hypothetical protein
MKRSIMQLCLFLFSTLFLLSCDRITSNSDVPDYQFSTSTTLKVVAPAYGENLKPGTTYRVRYDVPPEIPYVTIALYRKSSFQFNIAEKVANSGTIEWTVPADIVNSVHYRLKIYDSNFPSIYYAFGENFYVKADWQ